MCDQDDFESKGRAWRRLYQMYMDENCSPELLAANLQSRIAVMLRICEGISVFPDLIAALLRYGEALAQRSLWEWKSEGLPEAELESLILKLEQNCSRWRLDTAAIRSARGIAIDMANGRIAAGRPEEMAERIVIDVTRTRVLDRARALSIGKRFSTGPKAYAFHEEVLMHYRPHARRMGASLLRDCSGRTVRRDRSVLRSNTRSLMYGGDLSI